MSGKAHSLRRRYYRDGRTHHGRMNAERSSLCQSRLSRRRSLRRR